MAVSNKNLNKKYTIDDKEIGSGSFGNVYKATAKTSENM